MTAPKPYNSHLKVIFEFKLTKNNLKKLKFQINKFCKYKRTNKYLYAILYLLIKEANDIFDFEINVYSNSDFVMQKSFRISFFT
jgi:hypothetical protein